MVAAERARDNDFAGRPGTNFPVARSSCVTHCRNPQRRWSCGTAAGLCLSTPYPPIHVSLRSEHTPLMTVLRMHHLIVILAGLSIPALPAPGHAQDRALMNIHATETAGFEDYRTAVGTVENHELHVALEVRMVEWRPWGDDGPTLATNAFAGAGVSAKVPGPLLRATVGTPVRVTLRNLLADSVMVRGLRDRDQPIPAGSRLGRFPLSPSRGIRW